MSIRRKRRGAFVSSRFRVLAAALAVFGVLVSGSIAIPTSAFAADYPTWADVAAARNDRAATAAEKKRIEGLLGGLRAEAERTMKEAEAKSLIYQAADLDYQEGVLKAQNLQEQADEAQLEADASELQAGQMAAQFARAGSRDLTATLFSDSANADGLLYGLGLATKISEQAEAIYSKAIQAANTAQSLTDQAEVAKAELEVLKKIAEDAWNAAVIASNAAAAALAEQETRQVELEAQLAFLNNSVMTLEAGYLAGVRERLKAAAALGAGEISASGWARPTPGRITDPYGYRIHPFLGTWRLHTGTDIAAGCGQNIYAASSGRVTYAGPNGTYGNWVEITHDNGVSTGYAHIAPGGILVSYGQEVGVGTNIAKVGSTGYSTGCHLHFEVRVGGVARDAAAFMAGQGITLGTYG